MTTSGSEPMIIAEALASDDSALIFSRISLRERSTAGEVAQRLGEVAAGLLLDGQHDGEEVHFRDRRALVHLLQRLIEGHAHADVLDQRSGTRCRAARGLSRPMILRHSLSGRPDLTPRTMTSMASANWLDELLLRALARMPRNQRGRPKADDEADGRRRSAGLWREQQDTAATTTTPRTPLTIQKCGDVLGQAGLRQLRRRG